MNRGPAFQFNSAAAIIAGLFLLLVSGNDSKGDTLYGTVTRQDNAPVKLRRDSAAGYSHLVVWGDSIANGMGLSGRGLNGTFNRVTNLGRDSAGLLNPAIPVKPLDIAAIPAGSVVLMNIGTNDVGFLQGKSQADIDRYAERVATLARQVRDSGSSAIIIGMQAPVREYGAIRGSNFRPWVETMERVNNALKAAADQAGIPFSENHVRERHKDGLHYTAEGYRAIIRNALGDAGLAR